MGDIRERFTKWYYRRGYRMKFRAGIDELIFSCPFWVRPLVYVLFSPCAYYREVGVEVYV